MRYGIFSDVHSNLEAFEAVISAYKKESIDKYLCLGDVVGYGADPKACIEITKGMAKFSVAGNHDWASVDLISTEYFNPYAKAAVLWTRKQLDEESRYFLKSLKLVYKNKDLTLVHGTLNHPEDFNYMLNDYTAKETYALLENDVCFIGHSHVAGAFIKDKERRISYYEDSLINIEEGNKYIVNAGSVGQPRDNNPKAAYCIYDTDRRQVEIKRIKYDVRTCRDKIIKAGLPRLLGERLLSGR